MTARLRPYGPPPLAKLEPAPIDEGRKEAIKTYIEQTKLLTTLASAFLIAPAGLLTFISAGSGRVSIGDVGLFLFSEGLLIASVLLGYLVMGSVAGSQDDRSFNVFRRATRVLSLWQIATYLLGAAVFIGFAWEAAKHSDPPPKPASPFNNIIVEEPAHTLRGSGGSEPSPLAR